MNKKELYQKKLQAEFDQLSAEIDKLKAKAELAQADAQLDYYNEIEKLRSMRDEAKSKLAEFNNASDDAWEDFKEGMDSALKTLGNSLKSRSLFLGFRCGFKTSNLGPPIHPLIVPSSQGIKGPQGYVYSV